MKSLIRFLTAFVFSFSAGHALAVADVGSANVPRSSIQFKTDKAEFVGDFRVFAVAVLLTGIAVPLLIFLRKKYPILGLGNLANGRIKLVERRAINAKLTLYYLDVDQKQILLAQSGENIVQIVCAANGLSLKGDGSITQNE